MDIVRITHLPSPSSEPPSSTGGRGHGRLEAHDPSGLVRRLNADWAALVADRAVAAQLTREPIAGHGDLEALLAATGGDRSIDMTAADLVLAQVVAAALEGRTLATRVALQRVLGPLVSIAVRRTRSNPSSRSALFDDLCSNAWLIIAGYPLARRPRRIASNICRDAEYLTCVRPARLHHTSRRASFHPDLTPAVGLRGRAELHPADELAEVLIGLGTSSGLEDDERALLEALASGASTVAIADRLGCTDRTVRNLRRRLVARLQELAAV
jgi:Homeodomain-like domain-containing protein